MNCRIVLIWIFTVLSLSFLISCTEDTGNKIEINGNTVLKELYKKFDSKQPGYGQIDYQGDSHYHIPKAYAQILIAELERKRHGINPELPNLATVAGRWLLGHAREKDGKSVGWGVPVAWDAYGDGSINPANTRYTISTAIVVDALLSWMEQEPTAPGEEILKTVEEALTPYLLPEIRTPTGLSPYSLQAADQKYDTFNPAAYLAGQLQRFSYFTNNRELAQSLQATADATVLSLLKHKKISSKNGAWYWFYSVQEHIPNDIPHAGYIIDGLDKYVQYEGKYSDKIELDLVFKHLKEFYDHKNGYIRGWPLFREEIERPARTYGIGIALNLICGRPKLDQLKKFLLSELLKYKNENGSYYKYPKDYSELGKPIVINEYETYIYRALIHCEVFNRNQIPKGSIGQELIKISHPRAVVVQDKKITKTDINTKNITNNQEEVVVPFVRIDGQGTKVTTQVISSKRIFKTQFQHKEGLQIASSDIPLKRLQHKNKNVIFTRSYPENKLFLQSLTAANTPLDKIEITFKGTTKHPSLPMFRAAKVWDDGIWLVFYDNATLGNYITKFSIDENGQLSNSLSPQLLPLLRDPAGGTYEMIPAIFLLPGTEFLHLIGGTLHAMISSSGKLKAGEITNCLRAIEAIMTKDGPITLCQQKEKNGAAAPFQLAGTNQPSGLILKDNGIPFNLRLEAGKVKISYADSSENIKEMFLYDITRAQQNGWLEFGVHNEEGRIAWSQIYYLNGLMDLLKLIELNLEMQQTL